jgi:hypothetical protein
MPRNTRLAGVRPAARAAATLTTVLAVLAATAAPAAAATPLPSGSGVLRSAVLDTYTTVTTRSYWSIVSTSGYLGGQSDLALFDRNGTLLNASSLPYGSADWIALDNNGGRLPTGPFRTDVSAATDHGRPTTHLVQFVAGDKTLSPGRPDAVVGFADAPWMVDIRDVYLGAGQTLTLTVRGLTNVNEIHIVQSTADAQTWTRDRAQTALSVDLPKEDFPGQPYSVRFTASTSGYHGLVFESRRWAQWVQDGTGGVGYATVTVA